jgi:hypothetical protein
LISLGFLVLKLVYLILKECNLSADLVDDLELYVYDKDYSRTEGEILEILPNSLVCVYSFVVSLIFLKNKGLDD